MFLIALASFLLYLTAFSPRQSHVYDTNTCTREFSVRFDSTFSTEGTFKNIPFYANTFVQSLPDTFAKKKFHKSTVKI